MMEVVAGGERPGGPFTRRNVQEWSRLDQLTGLLEHARVETDHWTASTSNTSHHFGKVVDSRSRNLADGGQEQRQQTKQLEVFQAHIPGGSLQVIRSSTSSSWQTHKVLSGGSGWSGSDRLALPSSENQDFDNLKLALNPLDLSSQKTKVSVGRSGSIGSRRPPSRPRSIVGLKPEEVSEQTDSGQLTELSSICQRVHNDAKNQGRRSPYDLLSNSCSSDQNDNITIDAPQIVETKYKLRDNLNPEVTKSLDPTTSNSHINLVRKKSCSSEDLHVIEEVRNETDSSSSDWRRSSKVRRSLQFPTKPSSTNKETIVIPVTKSVAEIKREIEARKQLVTNSFKTNQWNNFAELEGVLGVVSNGNHDDLSKDSSNSSEDSVGSPTKTAAKKRQTFITVESLKEVRGRLRKLNSPVDGVLKIDDTDDGIDTEVKPPTPPPQDFDDSPKNSVKSYVNGMEAMLRKSKHPITGTGSLESRTSNKSLTNGSSRTEEWYNRRKSYGFEQVSNQQNDCSSFDKGKIESSTDSGICRSSDTFPSWSKLTENPKPTQTAPIKTIHNIKINPYLDTDTKKNYIEGDAIVQKGRKTVVNLTSNVTDSTWAWSPKTSGFSNSHDESKEGIVKGKIADTIRSLCEKSTLENQRLSEPIMISIPIQQSTKSNSSDPTNLLLKQSKTPSDSEKINSFHDSSQSSQITPYSELLFGRDAEDPSSENSSAFDSIPWRGNRTKALSSFFDSEFKRHSIAVDQAKYLTKKQSFGSYFNGVHDPIEKDKDQDSHVNAIPLEYEKDSNRNYPDSDHELNAHEKKHKRVEFCKTEVHFAAEPGRFNIVETDGKPPPSNMYRRRRKTTSDAPNRSGLPEIRFGDTQYEKNMLSTVENSIDEDKLSIKSLGSRSSPVFHSEKEDSIVLAPSNTILQTRQLSSAQPKEFGKHPVEEQIKSEDESSKPRSILKNNIPKPKPYLLGESSENPLGEDNASWGVKLKSVRPSIECSKWQIDSNEGKETEFQKLLKSLRPAANKPSDLFEHEQSEQFSTAADNGLEVRITSSTYLPDHRRASWSVADRIRHAEETRGYSTKVNFGPQETTVVRADDADSYFNSSDGISSWLTKEKGSSFDTIPRLSPSFESVSHPSLRLRSGADSQTEPPRVTSIALHCDGVRPPVTAIRPTSLYGTAAETKQPVAAYVSRNLLNSDCSEIESRVELSNSGERTWSFSKPVGLKSVPSKLSESDQSSCYREELLNPNFSNSLHVKTVSSSPSRFSRNSQSPSKEALFLERNVERSMLYNEKNRHMSTSPTSGTSKAASSVSVKLESVQSSSKKSDIKRFTSKPFTNHVMKNGSTSSTTNLSKSRLEEKIEPIKKNDVKKPSSEIKTKERRLSTSSSGRDGWLNAPKEVQVRKKSESSLRKQDVKRETKTSNDRSIKLNGVRTHKRIESPIYQNREVYAERRDSNDNTETESTILEELTKAADQILLAVNGYTDDDSFRASSDDEYRKKREKPTSQPLCTISEQPTKTMNTSKSSRQSVGVIKSTRSSDLRKEYHSSSKTRTGKTSSNSSVETGPSQDIKPLLSSEDRSKRRAARLLQRASSRELLFQSAASSSEDIGSGSDTGSLRTKRVYRRPRMQNGKHSGSKQDLTTSAAEPRSKERVHRSAMSEKSQRPKTQAENRCSRHTKTASGTSAGERRERRSQAVVTHHSSRTQKNTKETSQTEARRRE